MSNLFIGFISFLLIISSTYLRAEVVSIRKSCEYYAGETDSRAKARFQCKCKLQKLVLEEKVGIYIEHQLSYYVKEVNEDIYERFRLKTIALTSGFVKMKKIYSHKWDGSIYYIDALVEVDIEEAKQKIIKIVTDLSTLKSTIGLIQFKDPMNSMSNYEYNFYEKSVAILSESSHFNFFDSDVVMDALSGNSKIVFDYVIYCRINNDIYKPCAYIVTLKVKDFITDRIDYQDVRSCSPEDLEKVVLTIINKIGEKYGNQDENFIEKHDDMLNKYHKRYINLRCPEQFKKDRHCRLKFSFGQIQDYGDQYYTLQSSPIPGRYKIGCYLGNHPNFHINMSYLFGYYKYTFLNTISDSPDLKEHSGGLGARIQFLWPFILSKLMPYCEGTVKYGSFQSITEKNIENSDDSWNGFTFSVDAGIEWIFKNQYSFFSQVGINREIILSQSEFYLSEFSFNYSFVDCGISIWF